MPLLSKPSSLTSRGEAGPSTTERASDAAHRDLRREVFDLNTIFEIGRRFNAVLDTNALLDGIILTAISQLGVGAATVALQTPENEGFLSSIRSKGWAEVSKETWEVPIDSPLAHAVCELKRPVRLDEIEARSGSTIPEIERLRAAGCEFVAPFRGRECLRGMLFLPRKLNGIPFSESDLRFLDLLMVQLSVAIDNAILYESERRYARDLIDARERLSQSERMAALGRLSVAIAHEINNPLGIIRNYIQIASAACEGGSRVADALDTVTAELDRIARIVRQLLDAFRPDSARPTAVDAGDIAVSVIRFVEPEMTQAGITITSEHLDKLPYVAGREDSLRQVFINILLNARDAMPRGGLVTVTGRPEPENVVIEVADQGCGLNDRDRDHVFDAFYSTKDGGRGTGLGLFISRSIVEGFGGRIEAASQNPPRHGAVFRIVLPRVDVRRPPEKSRALSANGEST